MTPRFKKAIDTVISTHEGGFQKRTDDPGNYRDGVLVGTKFGISARTFRAVDIVNLTREQAEQIYYDHWGRFELLQDQRVLTKVLDLAVNLQFGGHGPATLILQKSVNACGGECTEDSAFGPETAKWANACASQDNLLEAICLEAADFYAKIEASHPEEHAWFANWNNRAEWVPPLEKAATA